MKKTHTSIWSAIYLPSKPSRQTILFYQLYLQLSQEVWNQSFYMQKIEVTIYCGEDEIFNGFDLKEAAKIYKH